MTLPQYVLLFKPGRPKSHGQNASRLLFAFYRNKGEPITYRYDSMVLRSGFYYVCPVNLPHVITLYRQSGYKIVAAALTFNHPWTWI